MADKTLDSELFTLKDNWPGAVDLRRGLPDDDILGAAHHNVAAAAFPVGTKIGFYNTGVTAGKPGWATFVYLKASIPGAPAAAAKQIVVQGSATLWYVVTNDPDAGLLLATGLGAVMISAMTDAYYGWFWCDGVCPEEQVAGLGGNFATDSSVAIGAMSTVDLTADAIGLGVATTLKGIIGYSLSLDAA